MFTKGYTDIIDPGRRFLMSFRRRYVLRGSSFANLKFFVESKNGFNFLTNFKSNVHNFFRIRYKV